jgi:hypothetical protein
MRHFGAVRAPLATGALLMLLAWPTVATGDPTRYEPGLDPDVGFNLASWQRFQGFGDAVWKSAVTTCYDAGFRSVSINPVRFFDPSTGAIATTSSQTPGLADVAAGIALAHSLGMTVTVTPYVDYVGYTQWRGSWGPTPGTAVSNRFWTDYQQYLVEVAKVAEANGANFMNMGVELNALAENAGNQGKWTSAINAVNDNFSGQIGYAAGWDDFAHGNVISNIWQNPNIDYMGVDAYFPLTSFAQANGSGTDPNPAFLALLESKWSYILDTLLFPLAHALKDGGMPVVFSEIGYLPYNGTTTTPPDLPSTTLDQDEQIMAFKALLAALDHRKADDKLLGINIWEWGMLGSTGSPFNMNLSGVIDQPNNIPATQFLADFVTHPTPEPSGMEIVAAASISLLALGWKKKGARA